ncbi:MAG TPA: GvpL/GvpF family gas vesicle protein [Pyrinomonadaceae bacterium]|nr:GvpL/GvpF family gas vesicle protein [Pyrinomonadaceae bacterium]
MKLYAYCVCDGAEAAAFEGECGVSGAVAKLVECGGGLAAFVSELDEGRPVAVTPENVRAHNRVNARLLPHTTPLPFRFGTLITEARLKSYVTANEEALREALARVGGCVEMGVKIMWGAGAVGHEAADADEAAVDDEADGGVTTTPLTVANQAGRGTAFLLAKRREILGGDEARARAEETAALLAARVGEVVRDSRVRVLPSRALLVRAAHLVERARLEEYRARVRALEAERAGGLSFLTSGAWPPYSFSEIRST